MSLLDLVILIVVAAICGSVGQAIVGFTGRGWVTTVALGFIGAILGYWLKTQLGLPEPFMVQAGGANFPVLWSIIGSALFVAVIALLSGKRKTG